MALLCAILSAEAHLLPATSAADPPLGAAPEAATPVSDADPSSVPAPLPQAVVSLEPIRLPGTGSDLRKKSLLFSGVVLLAVPLVGELTWWRNGRRRSFTGRTRAGSAGTPTRAARTRFRTCSEATWFRAS